MRYCLGEWGDRREGLGFIGSLKQGALLLQEVRVSVELEHLAFWGSLFQVSAGEGRQEERPRCVEEVLVSQARKWL